MSDRVYPGPICSNRTPREAVCVHTRKVYDSCRDKECLQDMRVYLTRSSQSFLDSSMTVKGKSAELLWAYIDVEPVPFNKGFYTVDVRYFYKITADAFSGVGRPHEICGLATFGKRTVLFGSEGSIKIFSSQYQPHSEDIQNYGRTNLPIAVVEVVDPVILSARIADTDGCCGCECALNDVPEMICDCFDVEIVLCDDGRQLLVTLGQFSIIKLERDVQLLMPAFDFCLPTKDCSCGSDEDPCELFQRFRFPLNEFFPPARSGKNSRRVGKSFDYGCRSSFSSCRNGSCKTK